MTAEAERTNMKGLPDLPNKYLQALRSSTQRSPDLRLRALFICSMTEREDWPQGRQESALCLRLHCFGLSLWLYPAHNAICRSQGGIMPTGICHRSGCQASDSMHAFTYDRSVLQSTHACRNTSKLFRLEIIPAKTTQRCQICWV